MDKVAFIGNEIIKDTGGYIVSKRLLEFVQDYFADEDISYCIRKRDASKWKFLLKAAAVRADIYVYNSSLTGVSPRAWRPGSRRLQHNASMDAYRVTPESSKDCEKQRRITGARVITFFHNVEADYARQEHRGWLRRSATYLLERSHVRHSDVIITLNARDSERLKALYGREADFIWPTTFPDRFRPDFPYNDDRYILFVGSNFFGNTEGLDWFIRNCLDHVRLPLVVVGAGMDEFGRAYNDERVTFHGFTDSLDEFYYNASAVVLPIVSGSGMKTKTCEALMLGKTIIGTDEAFEGYSGVDEAGCIRCNTADEFIAAINSFEGPKLNEEVRRLFLGHYCEGQVSRQLKDYLDSI